MSNHMSLKDGFAFDGFFEVPIVGNSREMALMWLSHVVHVSLENHVDQEVHAKIQVYPNSLPWFFWQYMLAVRVINDLPIGITNCF